MSDDFVWRAILDRLSGQGKMARTNFLNIKCPMCRDYKRRCGLKNDVKIVVSCYNCGFVTGWSLGSTLGPKFRAFLVAIGMTDDDVGALNFTAFRYKATLRSSPEAALYIPSLAIPTFETGFPLPHKAKSFKQLDREGCVDPDYLEAKAYIVGRSQEIADAYNYYWSPSKLNQMNRRIIIPMSFQGRTLGYSARSIDPKAVNRYQMEAPPNFLFNADVMSDTRRKYIILAEGILDAIALDCVGLLGARLNADQIAWIKSCNKTVILLVDRDKRGQYLVDLALANHWHVSFAVGGINGWWDPSVKDAAEATNLYGSLWTLTSVITEATNNKMAINYQRKKLLT